MLRHTKIVATLGPASSSPEFSSAWCKPASMSSG
jgi:pyruvate kinase